MTVSLFVRRLQLPYNTYNFPRRYGVVRTEESALRLAQLILRGAGLARWPVLICVSAKLLAHETLGA